MFDWNAYFLALVVNVAIGVVAWAWSVVRRNVAIVDSLWSLMILAALVSYVAFSGELTERGVLLLTLVALWALRLSAHITIRSIGEPEDRRYQEIRANNQPHFWLKSLYIVFGLQAGLAWFIAMPAVAAATPAVPLGWLDLLGVLVWVTGMTFEVVGDWQLARFRRERASGEAVLDAVRVSTAPVMFLRVRLPLPATWSSAKVMTRSAP